jgi:hypothetical protein
LWVGYHRFLPHLYQFIIHNHFTWPLYSLCS